MTPRRIIPALVALAGLFCAAAVADAGTFVNATFQGQNSQATPTSGMGVHLYDSLNSWGTPNAAAVTNVRLYEGGAFDFKVNNLSSMRFMVPGGNSSSPRIQFEEMWGKHNNSGFNPPTSLTTSQAAGAFQLAVWKLEYDDKVSYGTPGSVNFGTSHVEPTATNASDGPVFNTAADWTNSLSHHHHHHHSSGDLASYVASSGANSHDPVSPINTGHQIATPEPSSNLIWLIVAALGVYPIMCRRSSAA